MKTCLILIFLLSNVSICIIAKHIKPKTCLEKLKSLELSKDCLIKWISKAIEIGIVIFSVFYKLPQIKIIYDAKGLTGIPFMSVYLELLSSLITCIFFYLNDFSIFNYGEMIFNFLGTLIILYLYVVYGNNYTKKFSWSILSFILLSYLLIGWFIGKYLLNIAFLINFLLLTSSKMLQIKLNFKNKSVGNLSFITSFLGAAIIYARVFTFFVEYNGKYFIFTNIWYAIINTLLLFQFMLYKKLKTDKIKKD